MDSRPWRPWVKPWNWWESKHAHYMYIYIHIRYLYIYTYDIYIILHINK
jgi:hypothetical protein